MKKIFKILISIIITLIYPQTVDSLSFKQFTTNDKANLIPDYRVDPSEFKIEYLDKRRKFFMDFHMGYVENDNAFKVNFSPSINFKNLKFKINLDYAFISDSSNYKNINDVFSFVERVEYFQYSFLDSRINFYMGEIRDFTLGHGYLVNDYSNTLTHPIKRNIGFVVNLSNSNKSIKYDLLISNLRDFSENSGVISNNISFLFSDNFPLNFGFSHVADLNQFSKYQDLELDYKRKIDAFQFDFTYPVIKKVYEKLYLIGEFVAIDYPEKRFYIRIDDDQYTNDKKSRDGIWGIAFPGLIYGNSNFLFKIAANYNSAIFQPFYFNSTYDFENVRYRNYDVNTNEIFYSDEANLLNQFSNSDSTLFVPKDMYGMINNAENIYPTYGFSTEVNLKINKHNNIALQYSLFKNISEIDDSFYNTLSFNSSIFNKIIYFPIKLDIFISKNFFKISESYTLDENLVYGFNLDVMLYESIYFISELKHIFYDINYDGKIDLVPYVNIGLNYRY